MIVVFLGPPGSGKGTQAKALCSHDDSWVHLSTGDLLREEIASESALGQEIKSLMDKGLYVSDDLVVRMVCDCISKKTQKNFILDGFPRTIQQAQKFEKALGRGVDHVVEFTIPDEKLIDRLSNRFSCRHCGELYNKISKKPQTEGVCDVCGKKEFIQRADDHVDVISKRLFVYHDQTKPLKTYFSEKNILHSIQADLDINTIQKKLQDYINPVVSHQTYKEI